MDVAGKPERGEVVDQIVAEPAGALQPGDVGFGELKILEIGEGVVEPGREQEAAPRRQPPHEELEHRLTGFATVQIGLDHVEFVEVGGEAFVCHGRLRAVRDFSRNSGRPARQARSSARRLAYAIVNRLAL